MDFVRLIVELQRRCGCRSQHEIRLGHGDRQVQRGLVPRSVCDRGEIIGTGISILTATILVLERQLERLRQIEPGECPIERRRSSGTERGSSRGRREIELEQRHERRHLVPPAAQRHGILPFPLYDPF